MIVELSLVNWCTLNCVGCPHETKNNKIELELDGAIAEWDIEKLIICGEHGEPLLHPDITNILLKFNVNTEISTNCESLTNLNLDLLQDVKSRLFFEVSVDGDNNKTHTLTRRGGQLNNVLDNSQILIDNGFNVSFISTRHELNEGDSLKIFNMIKDRFNKRIKFRDTNEVGLNIKPPKRKSNNSDVSFIFDNRLLKMDRRVLSRIYNITPNKESRYVNFDGRILPCWALSEVPLDDVKGIEYKDLCNWYRKNGDVGKCIVHCGISYEYDEIEDVC